MLLKSVQLEFLLRLTSNIFRNHHNVQYLLTERLIIRFFFIRNNDNLLFNYYKHNCLKAKRLYMQCFKVGRCNTQLYIFVFIYT